MRQFDCDDDAKTKIDRKTSAMRDSATRWTSLEIHSGFDAVSSSSRRIPLTLSSLFFNTVNKLGFSDSNYVIEPVTTLCLTDHSVELMVLRIA